MALLPLVSGGCGRGPGIPVLSEGDLGDLRSAVGEKRKILEIVDRPEAIYVILEFPRDTEIGAVEAESTAAIRHIQEELRSRPQSTRRVAVWAHTQPNEEGTFRILGSVEAVSASAEAVWRPSPTGAREAPVPGG